MKITIDVGNDFYHRLANRNAHQGDGKHTAIEFREKYLSKFDNAELWKSCHENIEFDFANVTKIGPSFANEAFAYFTKYVKPEKIKEQFMFTHISKIQKMIIDQELETGYSRK